MQPQGAGQGCERVQLNYDFDMVPQGPGQAEGAAQTALFRDAETLAELHKAPEAVRRWLAGAGFGLSAKGSDLPPGHYAARDEIDRLALMQRLTRTMKDYDLPKGAAAGWSDFVIADFVEAMAAAQPLRDAVPPPPAKSTPQIPTAFARKRGKAAKAALAEAAPRGWRPTPAFIPFAMLALARRQCFVMLSLGTAFVYCAVLLYVNR